MRISSGGSEFVNILQTDTVTMRGADKQTNDGIVFSGLAYQGAASSNYSQCQLYNPDGSGKTILVDAIDISSSAAMICGILHNDTALTTDVGDGVNYQLGSAAASAQLRAQNSASVAGTDMGYFYSGENFRIRLDFSYPIEIAEEKGLVAWIGQVNVLNRTTFYFREV